MKYLIRSVVSVAIFVSIMEAALVLFAVDPRPKGLDFIVNRALDYPEAFVKDHDLFWRLRSNRTIASEFFEGKAYRINRRGFRGADFRMEKTGLRVAVLGNSCSFGWGVLDDETFADRLQQMLRRRRGFENAEVYNFSVPGYTSYQGKINYRKYVRPYKPDILLVTFAWNDHWLSANKRPDKDQKMPPQALLDVYNVVGRLRFYRLVKGLIFSFRPATDTLEFSSDLTRVSLNDFQSNLGQIVGMARQDGVRVILMTSPIPSLEDQGGAAGGRLTFSLHNYYNDQTREAAARYETGLVDLAAIFDQYRNLFDDPRIDPFHYSRQGHAVAAEAIFPVMMEMP